MKRALFSVDGVMAGVCAAAGAVVMAQSIGLGFGKFDLPGAGLFPFFAGLMISVGALAVIVSLATQEAPPRDSMFEPGGARQLAYLLAIFALWILIIPFAGFVIGTFLCVLGFAKALRLEGWVKPVLLALATSVCIYVMFDRLLQLDLPAGPWGV